MWEQQISLQTRPITESIEKFAEEICRTLTYFVACLVGMVLNCIITLIIAIPYSVFLSVEYATASNIED